MEKVLVPAIKADPDISGLVADRVFAPTALGVGNIPADPQKPYLTWNEMPSDRVASVRETSRATLRQYQFFVYDEAGDTLRVNEILSHLRRVVEDLAPYNQDGIRISEATWLGESQVYSDDEMGAVVRYGLAQFMVNG